MTVEAPVLGAVQPPVVAPPIAAPVSPAVTGGHDVAPGAPWTLLFLLGLGLVLVGLVGVHEASLLVIIFLTVLFLVFLLRHLAFAMSALASAPRDMRTRSGFDYGYHPFITVMVPCRNEELVIEGLVTTLMALDYPDDSHEIFVIDDGSDDRTGVILDELSARYPVLKCIHRPPGSGGGKSGALNTALAVARGDVCVVFDADHKPRADVLRRLVRHFADPAVSAVQGRCIVRNSNETRLARSIAVDYYCGYLVNEYGRQSMFELPAYGGSNCAVRTSWLRAFGGWNEQTVTEDTDLTLRLVLVGRTVRFDVTAIDTEESVPTFRRFWRQRYRWARGHQQVWREYRRSVWSSRSLSLTRKLETTMFLLVYHVPVFCMLGLVLVTLRAAGVLTWGTGVDLTPIATLLFLGPLLELASGLIVSRAPRRAAIGILLFLPGFVIFTFVCTKSWVDGLLGRRYTWVKTARTGYGQQSTVDVEVIA
ncbi:MAG TPA: glycosyltransferase family 2 protein [Acidimicrobiia bacterium]|nr:glycosyltransferase family 2 protein [Acidimicrobiia bacterium]